MENAVILVTNYGMGNADEKLQVLLFGKYCELLLQNASLPRAICFYTNGVRLVCQGSPALNLLKEIESKGVHLIICSTCLNYLELTDSVRVGIVGGMGDILEAQSKADKVITI